MRTSPAPRTQRPRAADYIMVVIVGKAKSFSSLVARNPWLVRRVGALIRRGVDAATTLKTSLGVPPGCSMSIRFCIPVQFTAFSDIPPIVRR